MTLMRYCCNKLSKQEIENWSVLNGEKEIVDRGTWLKREITCSKGSSVSSVEGGIRHERRILYSKS